MERAWRGISGRLQACFAGDKSSVLTSPSTLYTFNFISFGNSGRDKNHSPSAQEFIEDTFYGDIIIESSSKTQKDEAIVFDSRGAATDDGVPTTILTNDEITINGLAGSEGILPFAKMADEQGKGVFVWVRASNPSAAELQDFADANGQKMYEKIAEVVSGIAGQPERIGESGYSNVGMVMATGTPEKDAAIRKKYENMWFLVPGYGSQGAAAEDCIRFCKSDGTGALINASRSIIYAYEKPKYKGQYKDNWEKCIEQAVADARVELANAMQSKIYE